MSISWQFSTTGVLIGVVVLILALIPLYQASKRERLSLPPGPKGWPLIGNFLDIPQSDFVKTYAEWARKYGKVVHVDAAGQPMIILNDVDLANEMLDKRGATNSDRPVLNMAGELAGFKEWTVLLNYGPRLKESRKYMHRAIGNRESLRKFDGLFDAEVRKYLKATLRDPDNVLEHIRRFAGAIIVRITYGYEVQEKGDPIIALAESAVGYFSDFNEPGAYLVDLIPLLKYVPEWFPGASFQKEASKARKSLKDMNDIPFRFTLDQMASGTAPPSFVSNNIQDITTEVGRENLKWTASCLFAGGADTTVSVLYTLYLVMTLFPDIQSKAQEEIDRVIGNDRLPELADHDSLPYLSALQSEIYRWGPVGPTGVPRKTAKSEILRGYHIPKGSIIVSNIWYMLHDPTVYSNPDLFSPERFLETGDKPAERDPRTSAFGFGRRICPGIQFAEATVWLAMATTLAVFRISKVVEGGVEVTPEVKYTDNAVSHPIKFKCCIKPRSAQAEALIHQS